MEDSDSDRKQVYKKVTLLCTFRYDIRNKQNASWKFFALHKYIH